MDDEARPDQPGVTKHHGEEPDDASDAGLVRELNVELGKVDLRLGARRRLESDLKTRPRGRPELAQ